MGLCGVSLSHLYPYLIFAQQTPISRMALLLLECFSIGLWVVIILKGCSTATLSDLSPSDPHLTIGSMISNVGIIVDLLIYLCSLMLMPIVAR